jgi:Tetratricopeptide repeat
MIRRLREQYIEAAPLLHSGLEMNRKLYGPDHPGVFEAEAEYGSVLLSLARYDESRQLLLDVLDRGGATIGHDHPTVRSARDALATVAMVTGQYDVATALSDTALAVLRRLNGDAHPAVRYAWIRSAEPRIMTGRLSDALARYDAADAMAGEDASASLYGILIATGRARIALMRNQTARADSLLRFAAAAAETALRPDHRYVHELKRTLGLLRIEQGRPGDVPALLEPVLARHRVNLPERHPLRAATLLVLADARLALHEPALTEARANEALRNLEMLPPGHWMQGEAKSLLGAALASQGRAGEGRALAEEGLRIISEHLGPDSPEAARARKRMTRG